MYLKNEILTYINEDSLSYKLLYELILTERKAKETCELFGVKNLSEHFPKLFILYLGEYYILEKKQIKLPVTIQYNNKTIFRKIINVNKLGKTRDWSKLLKIYDLDIWDNNRADIYNRNYKFDKPIKNIIQKMFECVFPETMYNLDEKIAEILDNNE